MASAGAARPGGRRGAAETGSWVVDGWRMSDPLLDAGGRRRRSGRAQACASRRARRSMFPARCRRGRVEARIVEAFGPRLGGQQAEHVLGGVDARAGPETPGRRPPRSTTTRCHGSSPATIRTSRRRARRAASRTRSSRWSATRPRAFVSWAAAGGIGVPQRRRPPASAGPKRHRRCRAQRSATSSPSRRWRSSAWPAGPRRARRRRSDSRRKRAATHRPTGSSPPARCQA